VIVDDIPRQPAASRGNRRQRRQQLLNIRLAQIHEQALEEKCGRQGRIETG
jgi:hypothetical protein